jgi:hypothetical protein
VALFRHEISICVPIQVRLHKLCHFVTMQGWREWENARSDPQSDVVQHHLDTARVGEERPRFEYVNNANSWADPAADSEVASLMLPLQSW